MKQLHQLHGSARRTIPARLAAALAVVGAIVALPSGVTAQQVPPLETGPQVTRATFANGQVQLRDAVTNAPLIAPRGYPLLSGQDPAVVTQIGFQEQPSGFDLIYDFTNTAAVDKTLGCLRLGIITMGLDISYLDLREGIDQVPSNANNFVGQAWDYPQALYSPAMVMLSPTHAMGISLQYPILEYKHNVRIAFGNPGGEFLSGEGGRGWATLISLATNGPEGWQTVRDGAILEPGEFHRYVVSVRVTRTPAEWVRTLVPYRNYFRSMYGGVRYQREDTPVWGTLASDPSQCSAANPLGWNGPWRPDLNGWASMATLLREETGGWAGTMVWLPGGCYWHNPQNNFPCTPASPWLSSPNLSTIFDRNIGMPSVSAAGKELGFWWGHSCQTSAIWDPPAFENFDPDNPVHYNRNIAELDLMAKAGATMIGLDSFGPELTPVWKQYRWIETMRLRYPNIKFVTEPTSCDIMHTLAPTFITGFELYKVPATVEDFYLLKHPNYLADFLLPGHEYWGSFSYNTLTKYFGVTPDLNRAVADLQRYASYGYRPVMLTSWTYWGLAIPPGIRAAKTWETTVPADLQISDAPIPFGKALGTGSRPSKTGGQNAVAGYRPARPSPASGDRLDTSAKGPRPQTSAAPGGPRLGAMAPAGDAANPRVNTTSARRLIADAIRRAKGLPPLRNEDDPPDDQSDVQTFRNDRPESQPAKVVPGQGQDPKR